MPTSHKRRLKQQPITSTSDDRLLCRFSPDAFTRLCPLVRERLWQPISGPLERVPRIAQVAARLVLVLVMDGYTFDSRVLHHLARAQFQHVIGCPHTIYHLTC